MDKVTCISGSAVYHPSAMTVSLKGVYFLAVIHLSSFARSYVQIDLISLLRNDSGVCGRE